ncbi:MAG: O-antigen ligase family protein [Cyanobacteria bacterium P01_D01_bin.36]
MLIVQNTENRFPSHQHLWLASLVALPYIMYGSLIVMLCLIISEMRLRGHKVWQICAQWGFGWLSAGMLLSASFGINRGDAFLQLVNFLPFFVLWGVFVTNPKAMVRPFATLEVLARWLVVSAMPLCAIALIEYLLKFEALIEPVKTSPLPQWLIGWLYEEPYFGHRARSLFDHPNALSAYLVMILGLGLGLLLKDLLSRSNTGSAASPRPRTKSGGWTAGAVTLCLAAVFCTGSRNGVLIALLLIGAALYSARRYRWAWMLGTVGVGAIASAVLSFGIGGRSLSLSIFTNDPRIGVWRLAIEMSQQRPFLGWGLSGLRELYMPQSIPGYDSIFHAHNIFLFLSSETGIPVTIGFCAIVGIIIYRAIRAYTQPTITSHLSADNKAVLLSYLLAMFACLLFSLFDVVLFDARLNVFSWGLLAALYLLSGAQPQSAKHH